MQHSPGLIPIVNLPPDGHCLVMVASQGLMCHMVQVGWSVPSTGRLHWPWRHGGVCGWLVLHAASLWPSLPLVHRHCHACPCQAGAGVGAGRRAPPPPRIPGPHHTYTTLMSHHELPALKLPQKVIKYSRGICKTLPMWSVNYSKGNGVK